MQRSRSVMAAIEQLHLPPLRGPSPHFPRTRRHISNFFNHNSNTASPNSNAISHTTKNIGQAPMGLIADPSNFYTAFLNVPKPDKTSLSSLLSGTPVQHRFNKRCSVGSFVEVEIAGAIQWGLVTHIQKNLFENTEITIVNAEGEIVQIQPTNITFHLNDLIKSSDIISSPQAASRFIKKFIQVSDLVRRQNDHLIPVVQAWYIKEKSSVDIDISKAIGIIEHHNGQYKTHPLDCLTFGMHLYMRSHPSEWRVTNGDTDLTGLMISDSVPMTTYTLNSISLAYHLDSVLNMETQLVESFKTHLRSMKNGNTSNILTDYRDSRDREHETRFIEVNMIVDFLKYYRSYPHTSLIPAVESLLGDLYSTSTSGISELLLDLRSSDPLFNAEIQYPETPSFRLEDQFRHIRFTNSNVAYALPSEYLERIGLPSHSELAISLDKVTSPEYYTLNIHVPDVGSFIPQSSKSLKFILDRVTDVDLSNSVRTLLSRENIEGLTFSEAQENTCLTISIRYPHNEDKPWYKTSSTIRLERLVNLKRIPLSDLNELWRSRFPVFSNLFNFFMPSDSFKVLNSQDKTILMNVFSMVDYWFMKRGNENSMEYQFSRKRLFLRNTGYATGARLADSDVEQEHNTGEFLKYLTQELKYIASEHVLKFQRKHKIPMLIQTQEVLPPLDDSLYIESKNVMIPNYEATKYEELTFYKDNLGMTPIMNYIGATYFLSPVSTGVGQDGGRYASLGLSGGLVQICEPIHDLESILNHWQVINHLQSQFVESQQDYKMGLKKLFMKNYHMMSKDELLDYYEMKVKPLQLGNKRVEEQSYRHLVLESLRSQVEQSPDVNWNVFKCVILRPSANDHLAKAYCLDLGLTVLVSLPLSLSHVRIGDQLICSQIASITHNELILQA